MISAARTKNTFLQFLFGLMVLSICLLVVFPKLYLALNIVFVVLLGFCYVIANDMKVKAADIIVACLTLVLIAAQMDIAKISILVAYVFWSTKAFYKESSIRLYRNIMVVYFLCVLVAYSFGFHQEYDKIGWSASMQAFIEEKGMGFTNANRCMLFAFVISCITLLLAKKAWHYLLILFLNYILFQYTQSRTFFYVLVLIVAMLLILKLFRCEEKFSVLGKLMPLAYLVLFVLSFVLPYFYSDTFLNAIFSGRLAHNKVYIDTGLSLFGNQVLENSTFDSSYLHMLLAKGILFFSFFSVLLISKCRTAKISNKRAVVLLAVFLTGFMEVVFLESNMLYLMGITLNADTKGDEYCAK